MPDFRSPHTHTLYESLTKKMCLLAQGTSEHLGTLVLNISEFCNMKCSYCFAGEGRYGGLERKTMEKDIAIRAIDGAFDRFHSIEMIKFFGGEPFLNTNVIEQVCRHVTEKRWRDEIPALPDLHVNTNGSICNEGILALIERFGISLTISVDGPQKIHDSYRKLGGGQGSFESIDRNIRAFQMRTGEPRTIEAVYHAGHLGAGLTMCDIHAFIEDRYDVPNIAVHPAVGVMGVTCSELNRKTTISEEVQRQYEESMYQLAAEYGEFVVMRAHEGRNQSKVLAFLDCLGQDEAHDFHCGCGVESLTVSAAGAVYPCYALIPWNEMRMADLPLLEDFHSEKFVRAQRLFVENRKSDNPVCAQCAIVKICSSCMCEMFRRTGKINAVVPVICDFRLGYAEGMLNGIAKAVAHYRTFGLPETMI